jgi:molybdopterin synthase catalytic subunit
MLRAVEPEATSGTLRRMSRDEGTSARADESTRCAVVHEPLDVGATHDWAVVPSCGAVVAFSGTVRDHAEGRDDVTALTYEAYEDRVVPVLEAIAAEMRRRWPEVGRVALLHRVGRLTLGEASVLVVVSAAHRPAAFEAARYGIDALKASAPIWKREHWRDGEAWGTGARDAVDPRTVGVEAGRAVGAP